MTFQACAHEIKKITSEVKGRKKVLQRERGGGGRDSMELPLGLTSTKY